MNDQYKCDLIQFFQHKYFNEILKISNIRSLLTISKDAQFELFLW